MRLRRRGGGTEGVVFLWRGSEEAARAERAEGVDGEKVDGGEGGGAAVLEDGAGGEG